MSKVYEVFSNRILVSSAGRHPREMGVVHIVVGVSWTPGQQLEGRSPMPGVGVFVRQSLALEGALSSHVI